MGWEYRGEAGPYYYRSVRCGETVRRKYFGKGLAAQLAAREDAERRAAEAAEQLELMAEIKQTQMNDLLAFEIDSNANLILEASMLTAGYRRTNYGPWRRQHPSTSQS
jgi:hypothetical protein